MQHAVWDNLCSAIHASGKQLVLCLTGGGTQTIGELLSVPGGSRSVIEAIVPYSEAALVDLLGALPTQSCSEPTARAMAMAAWMRGRQLVPEADPHQLVGLGATASLASDRPKRGEHRLHVALQTSQQTFSLSVTLAKDERTRAEEEALTTGLILLALAEACGVDCESAENELHRHFHPEEVIDRHGQRAEPAWTELLLGEREAVPCLGLKSLEFAPPPAVFPGAFNPIHRGHEMMAEYAAERLGREVVFEITVVNVEKPPLDFVEIDRRLSGIAEAIPEAKVVLTTASTFDKKAELFPGCTFVVGADTILRIADCNYYGGQPAQCEAALQTFVECNCRFLVFGRRCKDRFYTLHDLELPKLLKSQCDEVPEADFHEDISSTEVRNGGGES